MKENGNQTQSRFRENRVGGMYLVRLGKICSNLSVLSVIFCLLAFVSVFASAIAFGFAVILILATLGIILLIVPNYFSFLEGGGETIGTITEFAIKAMPVAAIVGLICAAASFVLLLTDKTERHTGRVVLSVLVIVACAVLLIVSAGVKIE